jgi:putative peptidoglycan lipid II flippase
LQPPLAYLQYGRTLMKVPIGMFGMAVGVASYPTISELVAAGAVVKAYALLCRAVRLVLLLTFAAQVCLTVAGFEAVYLIWGLSAHRFSLTDAQETATVLLFLSIGLSGWAAQTLISRGFYALGSTWLPTFVGTAIAVAMAPVYVVLREHSGAIGLAVASSVAIIVYVMVLGWLQRRRFEREAAARGTTLHGTQGMLRTALRLAMAALVATALGLLARSQLLRWLPDADATTGIISGGRDLGSQVAAHTQIAAKPQNKRDGIERKLKSNRVLVDEASSRFCLQALTQIAKCSCFVRIVICRSEFEGDTSWRHEAGRARIGDMQY